MSPLLSRSSFNFGFNKRKQGGATFSASGGNVTALAPGNGYKYHTFTSPGTFTISGSPGVIEVFAVGGGGDGGGSFGTNNGAGGGGGVVYRTNVSAVVGQYTITVGTPGSPTTTGGLASTAYGGGAGGSQPGQGNPGGSGGGARAGSPFYGEGNRITGTSTPAGTPPQGNPGTSAANNSGGGGGAGGAAGGGGNGMNGGPGASYPQFTGALIGVPSLPGTYAAGGQGCSEHGGCPGAPGQANTGNGGGGNFNSGGTGGSGVVVIRYLA